MSALQFVGVNQPAPEQQTPENATLIFNCPVSPEAKKQGIYSRHLAVAFDIEEYAKARLDRSKSKDGKRLFSWYAHWKPRRDANGDAAHPIDHEDYVDIDHPKYKGPSLGSMFRLSFLEQEAMRESEAYKNAIANLPDDKFTEQDKVELLKMSNTHGKSRGSTATMADKTDKVIKSLKEQGNAIVASTIPPAEMADLADKIEQASKEVVEQCRKPLEEADKKSAERRALEQAVTEADTNLRALIAKKTKSVAHLEKVTAAFDKQTEAEEALANFDAEHAKTEEATPEPEQTEPAEAEANAEAEVETEPATDPEVDATPEEAEQTEKAA